MGTPSEHSEFCPLLLALLSGSQSGAGARDIKGWVFHAPHPGGVHSQKEQGAG